MSNGVIAASPVQTLDLFCPGAPVEIRVKLPGVGINAKDVTRVRRFDNHDAAAEWAEQFPTAKAIYFVLNPFDASAIKEKAVDDNAVTGRRWLLIDLDVIRDADTNSTDAELAKAQAMAIAVREYLTNSMGWPRPVEAMSGNGVSLLVPVDLPNDAKTLNAVEGFLNHLSGIFSDEYVKVDLVVKNASRITKLYGTMTRKGPHTPERPQRMSAITVVPEPLQVLAEADFWRIAGFWAADSPSDSIPKTPVEHRVDRDKRIEMARSWLSGQSPAIEGQGGDTHTFQVCCGVAVEHDLSAEDAFQVLQEWNARCQPPWSVSELRDKIRNAERYAKAPRGSLLIAHPHTEAGDAETFADRYRELVRYDHRRGRWLLSDGVSGIWVPDPVEQLTRMTVEVMRQRQRDALTLEGDHKKKALTWAIGGESRKRLGNALALARSVPPIADTGNGWDQNPFLLGVQNGVVDLQTGQFRRAVPEDRVTMRVRVSFDTTATCPLWTATLRSIFAPSDLLDADESQCVISFMQRAIGYSVTGDCREECCFFTWGSGRNGKGTLMNTLGWLLAEYADDMPVATLERPAHGGGIPNDVAKLDGKRFITCSEVNEFTLNETRLKALTGRDPMTARFLHREWFTFIPVGKIWIATNNKPKIVGTDDGIWSRIHLIPFLQKYEQGGPTINTKLKDQLREELPGILNWIIAGTQMWMRDGLAPPKSVKAATAAYRHESNPVMPFLEACCVRSDGNLRVQPSQAFKAYEKFCAAQNVEPWKRLSDKAFYKSMEQVFAKVQDRDKKTRTQQNFYVGVGLREGDAGSSEPIPERETQCDDVS